jgi:hypothetical protein
MRIDSRLERKARLKMRGLVDEINDVHEAGQRAEGRVMAGATVEIVDADDFLNALDQALVTIRTIDKEIFERSDAPAYEMLRRSDGAVVRGLTAPRNAAVHFHDVIDPDVKRAVGPIDGRFIIFPRWKTRNDIPADAFAKTAAGTLTAFDAAVGGRNVTDTLLDAVKFFDECDDSLLERSPDGQIKGLPLAPLPIGGYHRLHPDWPTHEEAHDKIRAGAASAIPIGTERLVKGVVRHAELGVLHVWLHKDRRFTHARVY